MHRFKIYSAIILILLFYCSEIVAYAAQNGIVADSPESVGIGRSFDVSFSAVGAGSVEALSLTVYYDEGAFNFKTASCSDGEVSYSEKGGKLKLICLFNNGLESKSDFLKLSFTAKTGQDSSTQKISFVCNEAVDSNLNYTDIGISEYVSIDIVKGSSTNTASSSGRKTGAGGSSSKAKKNNSSSGKNTKDKNNRSKAGRNEDNSYDEKAGDYHSDGIFAEAADDTIPSIGFMPDNSPKYGTVIAGIGIGIALSAIVFIAYRLGRTEGKREKSSENDSGNLN